MVILIKSPKPRKPYLKKKLTIVLVFFFKKTKTQIKHAVTFKVLAQACQLKK